MERRLVEESKVRASKVVLIPYKKSKDITITPMLTESGIDIVDMVASYSTTGAYKMNNFLPLNLLWEEMLLVLLHMLKHQRILSR